MYHHPSHCVTVSTKLLAFSHCQSTIYILVYQSIVGTSMRMEVMNGLGFSGICLFSILIPFLCKYRGNGWWFQHLPIPNLERNEGSLPTHSHITSIFKQTLLLILSKPGLPRLIKFCNTLLPIPWACLFIQMKLLILVNVQCAHSSPLQDISLQFNALARN